MNKYDRCLKRLLLLLSKLKFIINSDIFNFADGTFVHIADFHFVFNCFYQYKIKMSTVEWLIKMNITSELIDSQSKRNAFVFSNIIF